LVFYCIEDPFETFDSHCPHDLGTPAGEVGTKRLVQCVQKAEAYCRETLLAALAGDDAATRPAITSLWPVPTGKSASSPRPPQTDNSHNNRNNGNGRNRGGGRSSRGTPQKQPPEQAKDKTPQKQTPQKQPQEQAKDKTKQEQPKSQKDFFPKATVQPPKQNGADAKPEQPNGNSQPAARPKKKRNPKPKATTQSFVVTMDDKGAAVVTNAPADNTSNGDGSGGGNGRKPRNIPKPANGNQRGGRGGRSRARNNRSSPKSDQGNGQSNQESGSNAPAPNA
jgi:hypothetical protein